VSAALVWDVVAALGEAARRHRMAKFARATAMRDRAASLNGGAGGAAVSRMVRRGSGGGLGIGSSASSAGTAHATDSKHLAADADDHAGDRRVIEFNMRTNAGKERPISSGSIVVDAFVEGVMPVWLRHRRWGPRFAMRYMSH
jgi:hypothetical protein